MDDMNMENGDEYVFIPSDNENEEENGGGDHESSASQSVFRRIVVPATVPVVVTAVEEIIKNVSVIEVPSVARMDTEGDQLLAVIDLGSMLENACNSVNAVDEDSMVDQKTGDEGEDEPHDQRYAVNYDFNLDSQELFNDGPTENVSTTVHVETDIFDQEHVTIKEEIEIEEAVVNFPDDEEAGPSDLLGANLELSSHDEHNLGCEVISVDSDVAASEDEEDCVLLSLIEQCPGPIKEEPSEERTTVENDHAYNTQPLDEQPVVNVPEDGIALASIETFMNLSKRLLDEAGSSVTDVEETLRSIASIEEQVKSLKEKVLSQREKNAPETNESSHVTDDFPPPDPPLTPPDPPVPTSDPALPPPLSDLASMLPSRQNSTEADNLSVVLSENCSEQLECGSINDLIVSNSSDTSDKLEDVPEQSTHGSPEDDVAGTEEPLGEQQSTVNLSKSLSQNRSEPLEHDCPPMECEQQKENLTEDLSSTELPKETGDCQPDEYSDETAVPTLTECNDLDQDAINDKNVSVERVTAANDQQPSRKSLEISNIEDLIEYGDLFTKECEFWLDKVNNNRQRARPEDDEDKPDEPPADQEEYIKVEKFMVSLTKNVQRLSSKMLHAEDEPLDKQTPVVQRVDVSVQTEKRKLTAEKARTLNEKYKKRLLSSLGEVEAVYSDSADSSASDASNAAASSEDAADEEDDDDEAFEKRQNRRKSKRMKLKLEEGPHAGDQPEASDKETSESARPEDDEVSGSEIVINRKRNIRRLVSTESMDESKEDEEEDASEPDLSQFLIPKSPTSSMVTGSDDIPVKNEPFSENDSEPVTQKPIIRTDSVEYDNDECDDVPEAMEDDEEEQEESVPIKLESSINLSPSHSSSSKPVSEAQQKLPKAEAEVQSDSELLEDVLPQVDDILLDVDDILPAAEGVVQDYLVEEEVRTEQVQEQKEEPREIIKKPKQAGVGKKIDSEEEAESDPEEKEKDKAMEDMTESELEEYHDNMREREIDKLCNLTNLEVSRNTNPQKPQEVKKKPVIAKKKDHVIDDILQDAELHHESEDSESDTEVLETEELFLQKQNENMKNQMLNQLSSSDTEQDSGSEDSAVDALREDRQYDSDDSAGSILMEKFLKSLNKDHDESGDDEDKEKKDSIVEDEKMEEDEEQSKADEESEVDKTKESEKDFVDDSDNEEAMEKLKDRLKKPDRKKSDDDSVSSKEKNKDGNSSVNKTTAIDPIDKQLFSKKMFREVDETLRKDREMETMKENGSITDRSDRIASDDSDVELLDVSMFQPKRKLKEKPLEDFDFSSSAKRATPQLKRKDVKDDDCISLSSESEAEVEETTAEAEEKENKKRSIRAMLTQDQLADETKTAQKDEEQRLSRLKKKNENLKKMLVSFKPGAEESNLVLDYDSKTCKAICVHPDIVKLLKPHQREGIRFMYDNSYGSVDYINKDPGSGCILAHCMGLGKTLQLITLLHTVMRYPQLKTKRVLVICPKSTVMNWSDEIQQWLGSLKSGPRLKVFYFPDNSDVNDKLKVLSDWYASTASRCGCMLIGYEAFRILVNYEKRKRTPSNILAAKAAFVKKKVDEYLLNPGADLVICDEGHQIKNKKSAISGAVSQIKTRRRIVLTGTPIQNNLKEYYCMVNFIKPSFLGSDREFNNLYANPIKNGQHKDSDSRAIKIMKQRSYVLHNKLSRFVQRREAGVLKEFLPEKFEYVLFVPLTPVQEKMYEVFLQMNEYTTPAGEAISENARGKKFKLLADYTSLRKIWTHPKVLEKAWETAVQEKSKRDARLRLTSTPDSDDDRPDDYNDISSGALSVTNDWWRKHLEANDLESLYPSNKLRIMFEILKQCHERGEKCLIFSAFVAVLNVVEHFMTLIHTRENHPMANAYGYSTFKGPWEPGKDYYRLDGKTQKNIRHKMITSFNDPSNKRTKCFLISAKAGGQGINLIGANRVIILDTSWNPSNDQQNIFRIFRLGQKRKCYVYRLLAMGTMEEKVYSRSVTKQAMSFRVVDEQQVDRHYSFSELAELYNLSKLADQVRETPILPADDLLASLLRNFPDCVFKYHEHDSLLENKPEQDLSEDDKKEAWAAYEREIQNNEKPSYLGNIGMMPNFMPPGAFPGAPGTGIGPYPSMNYPGLSGALADMYRSDFGYGSGMNRLMYPYGNQPFPMINDPSYSSIMGKQPYPNFNIPGSSGSIPDFGLSAAINGQGQPGTTSYNSTVALQSLLDLYAKSMSSGMSSSSTMTTATATAVSQSTLTSSAGVSPYSALSSLKQFNGFPPGPPSSAPIPHSSPQHPPPANLQIPSTSGNAALINMLNEQPMPMSSAASSGPFSHLNSPLPAPSIPIPRSSTSTTVTTMATSSPVLTTPALAKTVTTSTTALNIPQPLTTRPTPPKTGEPKSGDPKPVPLTTTILASDDDDVDDDGIPRPHIIVRDPSSINASSVKPADKEKVVKKINMGIVYPEEKKKNQSKDIMLSAKSITNLAKPTIAVKSMESMKSGGSKTSSPAHIASRPGPGGRPIRASPLQSPLSSLHKPTSRPLHPLGRTPLTSTSSSSLGSKPSPPARHQVPVITSAKSLQMASASNPQAQGGTFNLQQKISNLSSTSFSSSTTSPTATSSSSTLPRGSIAAQQLRELQQRMNLSGTSSSSSASNNTSHLVVAKPKKTVAQLITSNQRSTPGKPSQAHPVGIFTSPSAGLISANQKQQKVPIGASPGTNNSAGRMVKNMSPLSDSVSITKITSTGQRIAMTNPSINTTSNTASMSPSLLSGSLGRKQDLVITKTIPGSATVRKVVPGPNMIVKAQDITVAPSSKRNFPPLLANMKSTVSGSSSMIPTLTSVGGKGTFAPGSSNISTGSISVRKRKAEPTLIDSLKAKNNSITISEVRSIYNPPAAKKPNPGPPIQPQKRLGSGITITPRKPNPQQQQQNILEVVEIE